MNILIIYDSFFGNTQKIAEAILSGFSPNNKIVLKNVTEVEQNLPEKIDVLIVGSPTRGFRPSPNTSKFLKSIGSKSFEGVKVAAFDTRINLETLKKAAFRYMVDKGGYAAKTILKQLLKKGGEQVAGPEGFLVDGEEGPITEGETSRAVVWAQTIESEIIRITT
ncbi:MAG: flavodoxin family protein [Prolixibacteraceae bacterium]|nr:flavodoxin family protein [Prolixibacteraceae bacterium]